MGSPDLPHCLLPYTLVPQLFRQGWVAPGRSLEDLAYPASGKCGFLHLTAQWIQNVDVVTATSAQGQIGSDFPFGRGGMLLLAL